MAEEEAPAPEVPIPDPLAPDEEGLVPPFVESSLLRAMRAAEGCEAFAFRVEMACWQEGVEYTSEVRRKVALNPIINALVRVDRNNTVSTTRVTDTAIIEAVQALKPPVEAA